jgi:hypothetical protein
MGRAIGLIQLLVYANENVSVKVGTDQGEQCSQTVFLSLMCDKRFLLTFYSWRTLFVQTFHVL